MVERHSIIYYINLMIKQKIIEKATEIIKEQSLEELSVRKMAKEVGIAIGSMYSYFQNIDDLIIHINGNTIDALHKEFLDCKDIRAMAKTYFDFASHNPHLWAAVAEHKFSTPRDNIDWYQEKIDNIIALVQSKIDQPNAHQVAILLWASLHGIWTLSMQEKLGVVTETKPQELIDLLLDSVLD